PSDLLDRGRPLSDAERDLLRDLIALCGRTTDDDRQPTTVHRQPTTDQHPTPNTQHLGAAALEHVDLPVVSVQRIVMEELARQDPALSVLAARHFLAGDLLAAYGGEAALPTLRAWRV